MKRLVLLALLVACTSEHELLDNDDGVITTCDEAWTAGYPGAPCVLDQACDRVTPDACCTDFAYCTGDGLVVSTVCMPECGCVDDTACAFGLEMCIDQFCQACPPTDVCAPCPDGWIPLTRNGCPTCQCGPPSECDRPGEVCPDGTADACYDGATCAEGCDAWQPGCCSNTCSAPGCPAPAPVGCFTACPPEANCQVCATSACECDGQQWVCDAICADDTPLLCSF